MNSEPEGLFGMSDQTRILLIDGRREVMQSLESALEDDGVVLVQVVSVDEALSALNQQEIALILLDVDTPNIDGYETAKALRAVPAGSGIPLLFFSAEHDTAESLVADPSLFPVDHIHEPINPVFLRAKVGALVALYRRQRQAELQEDALRQRVSRLEQEIESRAAQLLETDSHLKEAADLHRRMSDMLQGREEQYLNIVDLAADAIVSVDEDFRIHLFNEGAVRIFGYSHEEVLGEPLEMLLPEGVSEIHHQHMQRFGKEAGAAARYTSSERLKMLGRRKDQTVFRAETAISKTTYNGRILYTAILRDVSERYEAMRALEESEARNRAMVSAIPDLLFTLNREGIYLDYQMFPASKLFMPPEMFIGKRVAEVAGPEIAEVTMAALDRLFGTTEPQRIEYETHFEGGTQVFESRFVLIDDTRALAIVRDITERRMAQRAERRQRELYEELAETAAVLNSALDFDTVIDRIMDSVARVIPHDAANLVLFEGNTPAFVVARGFPDPQPGVQLFENVLMYPDSVASQILREGRGILSPDGYRSPSESEVGWIESFMGVPIRVEGQIIGLMFIGSMTPNAFDERKVAYLQVFADQAASAIHNANLFAQVQSHTADLESRVEERTKQLNNALERSRAILNTSSTATLLADSAGTISDTNPAMESLFLMPKDALLGRIVESLVAPEYVGQVRDLLAAILTAEESKVVEVVCQRQDGSPFFAELGMAAMLDAGDLHERGVVCSFHDISESKEAEAELRVSLEHERELNVLRTRFVSMVSHEFRTPMATILATSQTLRDYSDRMDEKKRNKRFEKIKDQVMHMTSMLDDVLMIGRFQNNSIELQPEQFIVEELFHEIVDEFRIANKGYVLDCVCPGTKTPVNWDPKLIRQIMNNLLSNAAKYSAPGSTVQFTMQQLEDKVVIQIRDEGIGIPEESLSRLFEPFYRATNVGNAQGTGLGLAITRRAVELHGGTIEISSQLGQGTVVSVELPFS